MKVIIICKEPFPNGAAATKRILCYARALHQENVDCCVLIYRRTEKDKTRNPYPEGKYQGVHFKYVGKSTLKPSHKIPRILAEYHDKKALCRYLKNTLVKGDVVIGFVNSDIDFICPLIDIIHSKGAKYVRELCEIPYFGNDNDALQLLIKQLFPKCDAFLTISETLTEVARKSKREDASILKVPILVDFNEVDMEDRSNEDIIPFIFHAGTLQEQKDGIIGMIRAFAEAKSKYGKEMKLVCTGFPTDSPDKDLILKTIIEENVKKDVIFTGYLKSSQVFDYLSRCTTVIVNKHDNTQNKYCFPTKLGEYLAAGKAVIITDVGEAMNWLKNGENALIVPKENQTAMADAIIKLISDEKLRRRIGEAGKELCRYNFDFRIVAPNLANFLKSL